MDWTHSTLQTTINLYAVAKVNFVLFSLLHCIRHKYTYTHLYIYIHVCEKRIYSSSSNSSSSTCGDADATLDDAKMEMMQMISGKRVWGWKDAHTVGMFFYPLFSTIRISHYSRIILSNTFFL